MGDIIERYEKLVSKIEDIKMYDGRGEYNGYICEKCGFVTNTYFNRVFKKKSGITPSNYRSINNIK